MKDLISWTARNYFATLSVSSNGFVRVEALIKDNGYTQTFDAWFDTNTNDATMLKKSYQSINSIEIYSSEQQNSKLEQSIIIESVNHYCDYIINIVAEGFRLFPNDTMATVNMRMYQSL